MHFFIERARTLGFVALVHFCFQIIMNPLASHLVTKTYPVVICISLWPLLRKYFKTLQVACIKEYSICSYLHGSKSHRATKQLSNLQEVKRQSKGGQDQSQEGGVLAAGSSSLGDSVLWGT